MDPVTLSRIIAILDDYDMKKHFQPSTIPRPQPETTIPKFESHITNSKPQSPNSISASQQLQEKTMDLQRSTNSADRNLDVTQMPSDLSISRVDNAKTAHDEDSTIADMASNMVPSLIQVPMGSETVLFPFSEILRDATVTGHRWSSYILSGLQFYDNFTLRVSEVVRSSHTVSVPVVINTMVPSPSPRLYLPPKPPDIIAAPRMSRNLSVSQPLIHFYANCGYYTYARQMLDEMSEQDVFSFPQQHASPNNCHHGATFLHNTIILHGNVEAVKLLLETFTEYLKPVGAIYSSFLQRGYDQVAHVLDPQGLPVRLVLHNVPSLAMFLTVSTDWFLEYCGFMPCTCYTIEHSNFHGFNSWLTNHGWKNNFEIWFGNMSLNRLVAVKMLMSFDAHAHFRELGNMILASTLISDSSNVMPLVASATAHVALISLVVALELLNLHMLLLHISITPIYSNIKEIDLELDGWSKIFEEDVFMRQIMSYCHCNRLYGDGDILEVMATCYLLPTLILVIHKKFLLVFMVNMKAYNWLAVFDNSSWQWIKMTDGFGSSVFIAEYGGIMADETLQCMLSVEGAFYSSPSGNFVARELQGNTYSDTHGNICESDSITKANYLDATNIAIPPITVFLYQFSMPITLINFNEEYEGGSNTDKVFQTQLGNLFGPPLVVEVGLYTTSSFLLPIVVQAAAHSSTKRSQLVLNRCALVAISHRKMIYKGSVLAQRILLKWKTLPLKHGTCEYSSLRTRMF